MAEAFARTAAEAVSVAGFDVLPETHALTPLSVGGEATQCLGALVITVASHNPGSYLGLKRGFWWIGSSRNHPAD